MANPPALSTKRPEADNSLEDGPSIIGGKPLILGGSITNFHEPSTPPSGTNQGLPEGLRTTLAEESKKISPDVAQRNLSEAIHMPLTAVQK